MRSSRPRRVNGAASRESCTTRRAPRSPPSSSASQRSKERQRFPQARHASAALRETARSALESVGRLAFALRPAALDEFGLVAALKGLGGGLEELGGPKVAFEIDLPAGVRLPADLETSLFRITQEALTNVVKHAEATTARVILTCQKRTLLLAVEDDGRGFSPAHANQGGFGLVGVRERVASLNGALDIQSRSGAGTRLTIEVPLA